MKNNYENWVKYKNNQFNKLKQNEMKLNDLFSEIYEISSKSSVENKHISINNPNLKDDIQSFISYAVGCMFGRYDLSKESIIFAGGNFNLSNYQFTPDDDNIIPVLDTEYFEDDIVGRFVEFVKTCLGDDYLEENLEFIASSINNSNKSPRDKIRDYFVKEFFNNHNKIYKKDLFIGSLTAEKKMLLIV